MTIVTDELEDEEAGGVPVGDDEELAMVVEEMGDEPSDRTPRGRPRRRVRIKMTGSPTGGR